MRDAIDSPAWGALNEWASRNPTRRTVHIAWTNGRWHVALHEHAPLPSSVIVASADTYGQPEQPLANVAARALESVEINRATIRARALAELRELAGE